MDRASLGAALVMAGARGEMEPEAVNAAFQMLAGAPILRPTATADEKAMGIRPISQTLDCNGDVLIAGKPYLYGDKKIMVLREEFGAGNIVDTYQRIFYLDGDFRESFFVVDGLLINGPFAAPQYKSRLRPVTESK